MKAFNIFFILLFLFSAIVQYNDPDPFVWIPIYLYGCVICYLSIKKYFNPWLFVTGLSIYLSYAAFLFFDSNGVLSWATEHESENIAQSMKATKPWIEETREFFGLLLLVFALSVNMIWLVSLKRMQRINAIHTETENNSNPELVVENRNNGN